MRSYVAKQRRLRFHPSEVVVSPGWTSAPADVVRDLRDAVMTDEAEERRIRNAAKRERRTRNGR